MTRSIGRKSARVAGVALFCFWCVSCINVGQERAEYEKTIGQKTQGAISVNVQNGHGLVRVLEPGRMEMWAQAPTLSWTITTDSSPSPWIVQVHNAMPDAKLYVNKLGESPQVFERGATEVPTRSTWSLDLAPDTTYTMNLRTDDWDVTEGFRFVVYADVQDKIGEVQDIYDAMKRDPAIRFGLISGDLTEQGAREELIRFQTEMQTLPFPCFASMGNHELGNGETTFHELFGRSNLSFSFKGTHFTLLDSASANIAPQVYPQLKGWLEAGKDALHMVIMHIPPLDVSGVRNGAFASRAEANKLLSMLANAGVDMTIYGHVHTFASYSNAGIPAYISGGGGAIPMRLDGIGRHYMKIDADVAQGAFVAAPIRVYPSDP